MSLKYILRNIKSNYWQHVSHLTNKWSFVESRNFIDGVQKVWTSENGTLYCNLLHNKEGFLQSCCKDQFKSYALEDEVW